MTLKERRAQRRAQRISEASAGMDMGDVHNALPEERFDTSQPSCEHLGEVTEHLPGCKCKDRPAVHRCHHPAMADREGVVERLPSGCRLEAVRRADLGICAACPFRTGAIQKPDFEWAVGVTTTHRPQSETLGKCLETLAAAGWDKPIVFADGGGLELHGATAVVRSAPAGALQNFYAAAAELVMRAPDAIHLLVQDDVTFPRKLREYLEQHPWPANAAVVKLFTADVHDAPQIDGWSEIPFEAHMKGAQAYVFPQGRLESFVRSRHAGEQRRKSERSSEAIDNVVASWARTAGPQYWHGPSLAEHHGTDNSTLGHRFGKAHRYPGDEFDATTLRPDPHVVAVMVTRPSRCDLARVAIDSFKRQSYTNTTLLIVTEVGGPRLSSSAPDVGLAPARVVQLPPGLPLGAIRNRAIEEAAKIAPLAIQWDDDDYSGRDRIRRQVAAWRPGRAVVLKRQYRAALTGGPAKLWSNERGIEGTILHETNTLHRYPKIAKGEDTEFAALFRAEGQLETIENDAADYVRFWHGANTWDESHILRGREVSQEANEFVDNVRLLYDQPSLDRWRILEPQIHGWSSKAFIELLLALIDFQEQEGILGDVLDIGIHHGRVTLALAAKLEQINAARDTVHTVDAVDPWPEPSHRQAFKRHHGTVFPEGSPDLGLLQIDSSELHLQDMELGKPTTSLVHVDGCHDRVHAAGDIFLALNTLNARGVLVVDDVHNPMHPEVGPEFWRIASEHDVRPFAVCSNRWLCAMDGESAARYLLVARQFAANRRLETKSVPFHGRRILVIQ